MHLRKTLILLGVALGMLLFIFAFERRTKSTDERKECERLAFPSFKDHTHRADAIEITRGAEKIVIVKRDAGTLSERWQITQPLDCPADMSRVIGLFGAFERAERALMGDGIRSKPLEETADLAPYGLTVERATQVRVSAGEETLLDALVGDETPGKGKAYAAPASRKELYIVDAELRENATRRVDEYRDKRLLNLTAGTITQVGILKGGRPVVEIAREQGSRWRVVSPVNDRADARKARDIVDRTGSLWADAFKEDFARDDPEMPKKLAQYGLEPAALAVKVTREIADTPQQHEVLFGGRLKKHEGSQTSWDVYAMVVGTRSVVLLPESSIEVFDVLPDDLRDRRVFVFERAAANKVEVSSANGGLTLAKKDDDWKLESPETHDADNARVRSFLEDLADLEATRFLAVGTGLRDPVKVEVTWVEGEKEKTDVAFFAAGRGEVARGRRGEDGAVFELPAAVMTTLTQPPWRLWSRRVLTFDEGRLTRLTVTLKGVRTSAKRTTDGWQLEGAGEADRDGADGIKWALSDLTADELVARAEGADLGSYGLDDPSIRVEAALTPAGEGEEERSVALLVGAAEADEAEQKRFYAAVENGETIFVLKGSLVDKFRKGLRKAGSAGDGAEGDDAGGRPSTRE